MPREPITHTPNSTNIRHIEYHPDEQRLVVEFHTSARHQYHPVHENTAQGLMDAPSAGSYFHKHIRSSAGIESTRLADATVQR
jgi:hypothetical protein